jgi:hypothetical protein
MSPVKFIGLKAACRQALLPPFLEYQYICIYCFFDIYLIKQFMSSRIPAKASRAVFAPLAPPAAARLRPRAWQRMSGAGKKAVADFIRIKYNIPMKAYHQGELDFFCALYAFINGLKLTGGLNLADARLIFAQALREISAYPILWQALLDNDSDFYWLLNYLLGSFGRNLPFAFKAGRLPLAPLNSKDRQSPRLGSGQRQKPPFRPYGVSEAELRGWLGLKRPAEVTLGGLQHEHLYAHSPSGMEHSERGKNWNMGELWPLLQSWLPVKNLFTGFGDAAEQTTCLLLRFHRYLYPGQPPVVSHWTTGLEFKGDTLQLFDCTADKTAVHSLSLQGCVLTESALGPERLIRIEPDSIYFLERVTA